MRLSKKQKGGILGLIFLGVAGGAGLYFIHGQSPKDGNSGHLVNSAPERPKDDYFIDIENMPVTTKDGRKLSVSVYAYCEEYEEEENFAAYKEACRAAIQKKLDYNAVQSTSFEGGVATISPDVRNHDGRPEGSYIYPPNYASFTREMLKRALGGAAAYNYYTVTEIKPVTTPKSGAAPNPAP